MAVKVRCSECRKKISVDEAFAGSMCRCPYCKAIVMVPAGGESPARESGEGGRNVRPDQPGQARPTRPGQRRKSFAKGDLRKSGLQNLTGAAPKIDEEHMPRPRGGGGRVRTPREEQAISSGALTRGNAPPESETETVRLSGQADALAELAGSGTVSQDDIGTGETIRVDITQLTEDQLAAIPTASPVRLQGIVSLVLLGVLVIMLAGCIYLGIRIFSGPRHDDSIYERGAPAVTEHLKAAANPFLVGKASTICGDVLLVPPVIYCIDAGTSMANGGVFTFARDVVRASILTLPEGGKFGVVVAQDSGAKLLGGKLFPGGQVGEAHMRDILADSVDGGAVEVGGASDIGQAVGLALQQKPKTLVLIISRKQIPGPQSLGRKIGMSWTKLALVVLGSDTDEELASYDTLTKYAGKKAVKQVYKSVNKLSQMYDEVDLPE